MPPIGSRIILSIAFGPKHVLMTSATVLNHYINTYYPCSTQEKMANLGGRDI